MNEIKRNRIFLAEHIFTGDDLRIIRTSPVYEYIDKQKTDKRIGTYLEVVDLVDFEKYRIKVPLDVVVPGIRDIKTSDLFNFRGVLYVRSSKMYWSLTADGIK